MAKFEVWCPGLGIITEKWSVTVEAENDVDAARVWGLQLQDLVRSRMTGNHAVHVVWFLKHGPYQFSTTSLVQFHYPNFWGRMWLKFLYAFKSGRID